MACARNDRSLFLSTLLRACGTPCVHFLTQSLYIHVMYPGKFNPLPFDQFGRELCDDQLIVCQLVSVGAYACVCVMRVCVCVCEFLW